MPRVTYFVRMVAKEGKAEEVQELLLTNVTRIEQGEPGNLAFAVHRSMDNPNESGSTRLGRAKKRSKLTRVVRNSKATKRNYARWSKEIASSSVIPYP